MTSLATLPDRYRLILCDVWGCVHDGIRVFPEARALLARWRRDGRIVLLLTNAPRPAAPVRAQLRDLGLDTDHYDAVISSGETGLKALRAEGRSVVGFIGTEADRESFSERGLTLVDPAESDLVVCTGFSEGSRETDDYLRVLTAMRERGARLLCFNPDRVVIRGSIVEPCAGAIADRYEAIGGAVDWFGKPYPRTYQRCLAEAAGIAGRVVDASEVIAIGDGLATDYLGAAQAGFDFIFVTGGIEGEKVAAHGAEQLLANFADARGLALPPPLAVVARLA